MCNLHDDNAAEDAVYFPTNDGEVDYTVEQEHYAYIVESETRPGFFRVHCKNCFAKDARYFWVRGDAEQLALHHNLALHTDPNLVYRKDVMKYTRKEAFLTVNYERAGSEECFFWCCRACDKHGVIMDRERALTRVTAHNVHYHRSEIYLPVGAGLEEHKVEQGHYAFIKKSLDEWNVHCQACTMILPCGEDEYAAFCVASEHNYEKHLDPSATYPRLPTMPSHDQSFVCATTVNDQTRWLWQCAACDKQISFRDAESAFGRCERHNAKHHRDPAIPDIYLPVSSYTKPMEWTIHYAYVKRMGFLQYTWKCIKCKCKGPEIVRSDTHAALLANHHNHVCHLDPALQYPIDNMEDTGDYAYLAWDSSKAGSGLCWYWACSACDKQGEPTGLDAARNGIDAHNTEKHCSTDQSAAAAPDADDTSAQEDDDASAAQEEPVYLPTHAGLLQHRVKQEHYAYTKTTQRGWTWHCKKCSQSGATHPHEYDALLYARDHNYEKHRDPSLEYPPNIAEYSTTRAFLGRTRSDWSYRWYWRCIACNQKGVTAQAWSALQGAERHNNEEHSSTSQSTNASTEEDDAASTEEDADTSADDETVYLPTGRDVDYLEPQNHYAFVKKSHPNLYTWECTKCQRSGDDNVWPLGEAKLLAKKHNHECHLDPNVEYDECLMTVTNEKAYLVMCSGRAWRSDCWYWKCDACSIQSKFDLSETAAKGMQEHNREEHEVVYFPGLPNKPDLTINKKHYAYIVQDGEHWIWKCDAHGPHDKTVHTTREGAELNALHHNYTQHADPNATYPMNPMNFESGCAYLTWHSDLRPDLPNGFKMWRSQCIACNDISDFTESPKVALNAMHAHNRLEHGLPVPAAGGNFGWNCNKCEPGLEILAPSYLRASRERDDHVKMHHGEGVVPTLVQDDRAYIEERVRPITSEGVPTRAHSWTMRCKPCGIANIPWYTLADAVIQQMHAHNEEKHPRYLPVDLVDSHTENTRLAYRYQDEQCKNDDEWKIQCKNCSMDFDGHIFKKQDAEQWSYHHNLLNHADPAKTYPTDPVDIVAGQQPEPCFHEKEDGRRFARWKPSCDRCDEEEPHVFSHLHFTLDFMREHEDAKHTRYLPSDLVDSHTENDRLAYRYQDEQCENDDEWKVRCKSCATFCKRAIFKKLDAIIYSFHHNLREHADPDEKNYPTDRLQLDETRAVFLDYKQGKDMRRFAMWKPGCFTCSAVEGREYRELEGALHYLSKHDELHATGTCCGKHARAKLTNNGEWTTIYAQRDALYKCKPFEGDSNPDKVHAFDMSNRRIMWKAPSMMGALTTDEQYLSLARLIALKTGDALEIPETHVHCEKFTGNGACCKQDAYQLLTQGGRFNAYLSAWANAIFIGFEVPLNKGGTIVVGPPVRLDDDDEWTLHSSLTQGCGANTLDRDDLAVLDNPNDLFNVVHSMAHHDEI